MNIKEIDENEIVEELEKRDMDEREKLVNNLIVFQLKNKNKSSSNNVVSQPIVASSPLLSPLVVQPPLLVLINQNDKFPTSDKELFVRSDQKNNPALGFLDKSLSVVFVERISPDFIFSRSICGVYVSYSYHLAKPDFYSKILEKVKGLKIKMNFIFFNVDERRAEFGDVLNFFQNYSFLSNFRLLLCFGFEEVAKYISLIKINERKSSEILKTKVEDDFISKAKDLLTSVKSVNSTDAITLLQNFSSLRKISQSTKAQLLSSPGLGGKKCTNILKIFQTPLKKKNVNNTSKKKEWKEEHDENIF